MVLLFNLSNLPMQIHLGLGQGAYAEGSAPCGRAGRAPRALPRAAVPFAVLLWGYPGLGKLPGGWGAR